MELLPKNEVTVVTSLENVNTLQIIRSNSNFFRTLKVKEILTYNVDDEMNDMMDILIDIDSKPFVFVILLLDRERTNLLLRVTQKLKLDVVSRFWVTIQVERSVIEGSAFDILDLHHMVSKRKQKLPQVAADIIKSGVQPR